MHNSVSSLRRIVIIGGGISGLTTAHRLIELSHERKQPLQITILEAGPRLGGTIHTVNREGFLLEQGPDCFISEKPEALALAKRIGLESQLITTSPVHRRSFIVRKGRLRPVPEGFQLIAPSSIWPFITSDIFSLAGKARMAADLFLPRRGKNGMQDESLASFVRRRLGEEALARMAQPMVGGIYTANPESLSLRATLPRFLDMESEHRSIILALLRQGRVKDTTEKQATSGARYSLFLSFDRGMQVLADSLTKSIAGRQLPNADCAQTAIRLNTRVKKLERRSTTTGAVTWTIRSDDETLEADSVCLAVPSYVAASLVRSADAQLATRLSQIKYASSATVNFAYRRADVRHPLNGFGFVVPFIEKRSLIACTFSSVKFSGRAPTDHVLLRAFVGGALQPEIFALEESEMLDRVKADLGQLLGITNKPLFTEAVKWENSMPQYEIGHLDRVNAIESDLLRLLGLTLAGNAYRGAGIPDCIRSGELAAETMMR